MAWDFSFLYTYYFRIIVLFGQGELKVRRVLRTHIQPHISNRSMISECNNHVTPRFARPNLRRRAARRGAARRGVTYRYTVYYTWCTRASPLSISRAPIIFLLRRGRLPPAAGGGWVAPRGLRTERELDGGCDGAGPLAAEVKVRRCTVENPLSEIGPFAVL